MNRILLACIAFSLILALVFFNYIYVHSVQHKMMSQIDPLKESYASTPQPDAAEKIWKSRKRLLTLTVPLTAIEKIDVQFSEMRACAEAHDSSAYLRACYTLSELIATLSR